MTLPTKEEFQRTLEKEGPVPLTLTLLADVETPLSAYWKLAHDEQTSFLLESVTGGEQVARYSMIGVRPKTVVSSKNGHTTDSEGNTYPGDPVQTVYSLMAKTGRLTGSGLPPSVGGAVGTIAYDYARTIEDLPDSNPDEIHVPDVLFMLVHTVVVFDHAKNQIQIVALADSQDAYQNAVAEIERIRQRLTGPLPPLPSGTFPVHPVRCNTTQQQFEATVSHIVSLIAAGEGVQMVPSIRFETKVDAHPLTLYRALRSQNPSPYMFLLRFPGLTLVGASPELLVSLHQGLARVRPIAGTRPRGQTPEKDEALAQELLADEKETAEHIMLVDLGRNDLGRVCTPGTVKVGQMMVVERYSHVMHIVSDVTGTLDPHHSAVDLVRATFPAGTLSGAPKVRAMEIIDEVETTRRGIYGGAVGQLSPTGDADLAIAIRSIVVKNDTAYVQAGAGVVFDSVPANEYQECVNKAKSALGAIATAQQGL